MPAVGACTVDRPAAGSVALAAPALCVYVGSLTWSERGFFESLSVIVLCGTWVGALSGQIPAWLETYLCGESTPKSSSSQRVAFVSQLLLDFIVFHAASKTSLTALELLFMRATLLGSRAGWISCHELAPHAWMATVALGIYALIALWGGIFFELGYGIIWSAALGWMVLVEQVDDESRLSARELIEKVERLRSEVAARDVLDQKRFGYVTHLEHRINNPVQGIVYVIDELLALVSHWSMDMAFSPESAPQGSSSNQESPVHLTATSGDNLPLVKPVLTRKRSPSLNSPRTGEPVLATAIGSAGGQDKDKKGTLAAAEGVLPVPAADATRMLEQVELWGPQGEAKDADGRFSLRRLEDISQNTDVVVISADTYHCWEQRVAEFNALGDMALIAVDSMVATMSGMHDGLVTTYSKGGQDTAAVAIRQPTNVRWVLERCEFAFQYFSAVDSRTQQSVPVTLTPTTSEKSANPEDVQLSVSVDKDVQNCVLDSNGLFSVVTRFLSNAKRFTKKGTILLSAKLQGEHLRFEIRDPGVGVKPDLRPLLFTLPVETNRQSEYSGYGLFLAKQKIDSMGGMCGYEPNSDGKGSTFWAELPYQPTSMEIKSRAPPRVFRARLRRPRLATQLVITSFPNGAMPAGVKDPDNKLQPGRKRNIRTQSQSRGQRSNGGLDKSSTLLFKQNDPAGQRILIVEDDPVQGTLLTRQIENLGFKVTLAVDGIEGLERMKEQLYRVVLCDKVIPRLNGIECVQRFRSWEGVDPSRSTRRQYICGVSANTEEELPEGFDMYLQKPLRNKDIITILDLKSEENL